MLRASTISSSLLVIILILFCIPFAFPQFELAFIVAQFSFLIPIYFFFTFFITNLIGKVQIIFYFFLLVLLLFGLPGSIVGWMSMACMGYLFGARDKVSYKAILSEIKPFIICSIILCIWVMVQNLNSEFDFDLLSDYFEKSSINTVPILMVCTSNLCCTIYFYGRLKTENKEKLKIENLPISISLLLITTLLSVIIFDFRSGIGIFLLIVLVVFEMLSLRASVVTLLGLVGLVLWKVDFNLLLMEFLAPGRDDLASVAEEVSDGALRYERLIQFWKSAAFSKTNFNSWSEMFSFSGMSDFVAALFPISILFFIPSIGLLKLFRRMKTCNWLILMIVFFSMLSSFIISILQPDFYSLFSFFAILSIIYFGEKRVSGNSVTHLSAKE